METNIIIPLPPKNNRIKGHKYLYKDEIRNEPHTRSLPNIIRLSELRGNSIGIKNAEAFEIFRAMNIKF